MTKRISFKSITLGGAAAWAMTLGTAAHAQEDETKAFDIEAQPLAKALLEFNEQSGVLVMAPQALVEGKTAPAIEGEITADEALDRILSGSGLKSNASDSGAITITLASAETTDPRPFQIARLEDTPARQIEGVDEDEGDELVIDVIVVTGTNIRGIAAETSPTIVLDREAIRSGGFATAEELILSLPQNGGGGVSSREISTGSFTRDSGSNDIAGSSVNLRGLGTAGTLTLLNRNRIAGSGTSGAFVDVSAIPLSAIERVEILTDGASAIYGSDAIAGVVNFVLREDYDGAETQVVAGTVTDGGLQQYRVSQTLGKSWSTGRALGTFEFFDQSELDVADRDFAQSVTSPSTLIPGQERFSGIVSFAQELSPSVEIGLDGYHSDRDASLFINFGDDDGRIIRRTSNSEVWGVTPFLTVDLGADWQARVTSAYSESSTGRDDTVLAGSGSDGSLEQESTIWSTITMLDGPAFALPGGALRTAVGGEFRTESFDGVPFGAQVDSDRDVYALFAEANIPVVGDANTVPGVRRLVFNAAARFDDYSDFGDTFNPKLGLLWSPIEGLNFRGSYATSFRPPELAETTPGISGIVAFNLPDPASATGTSPVLFIGGTGEFEAEESTSYTAGADFEFSAGRFDFDGAVTYYNVEFTNQIGPLPIQGGLFGALQPGAVPTDRLTPSPSQAFIDEIAGAAAADNAFFSDFTGLGILDPVTNTYDASLVRFFIDTRSGNLSSVDTDGIDFRLSASTDTDIGWFSFGISGNSIFTLSRQAAANTDVIEFVDTVFNPSDFRLRGSIGLTNDDWTASLFVNHVGSYTDTRPDPAVSIDSFTTIDLNFRYQATQNDGSLFDQIELGVTVRNLFDEEPPFVADDRSSIAGISPNYDPANADPLGRFVSVSITKAW